MIDKHTESQLRMIAIRERMAVGTTSLEASCELDRDARPAGPRSEANSRAETGQLALRRRPRRRHGRGEGTGRVETAGWRNARLSVP
jgi:hypothetical protein